MLADDYLNPGVVASQLIGGELVCSVEPVNCYAMNSVSLSDELAVISHRVAAIVSTGSIVLVLGPMFDAWYYGSATGRNLFIPVLTDGNMRLFVKYDNFSKFVTLGR